MKEATPSVVPAIVAGNASFTMGGEAYIPIRLFLSFHERGIPAVLLVHERVQAELKQALPEPQLEHVVFFSDTFFQKWLYKLTTPFQKVNAFGLCIQIITTLSTQRRQAKWLQKNAAKWGITVIHQANPVSPRSPSAIQSSTLPVVIGPMNGDINYPPGLKHRRGKFANLAMTLGRALTAPFHWFFRGKKNADCLLVANERTKAVLPKSNQSKIQFLVENGINLEAPQKKPKKGTACRFVFTGRLIDLKGVDLLIQAFKKVSLNSNSELIICGDGEKKQSLIQLAKELDCKDKITFTGWLNHDQVHEQLSSADIFVFSSFRDCGGASILEAMKYALPVIAVDWGGPHDYLVDGGGILIPPTSEQAIIEGFTEQMLILAKDSDQRISLGKEGQKIVFSRFTWQQKTDDLLRLYDQLPSKSKHLRAAEIQLTPEKRETS